MTLGPWWIPTRRRRRIVRAAALVVGALGMVCAAAILIAVLVAPAAAPVIAAATVLGQVSEVFGDSGGEMTGEELARASQGSDLRCDAAPSADPDTEVEVTTDEVTEAEPVAAAPIKILEGGSISREDAELLIGPLSPGTSALRAHVWFLYRLAGVGDWAGFATAYEDAGLSADEESPDAPLRQVQLLNTSGADIERYRLTAAALVEAGQRTGRFTDPYPDYRELVAVELIGSCLSDSGAERMTLPAPSTTAAAEPTTLVPAETFTAGG